MLIYVVDDHPLMREAIVMLFRRLAPDSTIADMDRLSVIEDKVTEFGQPDLFCLDLKLPDTYGVSGVREMRARFPHVPIVVLSASPSSEFEQLSLEAGADLYLEKSTGAANLSQTLRALVDPDSAIENSQFGVTEKLSRRQRELLTLLDKGLSNKELADHLQISEHTVKVHLWRLFRRLEVKSRAQAVSWARSRGII